jgi:hypothetical protein
MTSDARDVLWAPAWMDRFGWRPRDVVAVVAVMLLAIVVRLDATRTPLSYDEVWVMDGTASNGQRPLPVDRLTVVAHPLHALDAPGVPPFTWQHGVPFHPPLHPATLRLWREWVSEGDGSARLYSALWSLLAIAMTLLAVRAQVGTGLACLTAGIMAVAPFQIHLGTEIRGYAMAMAITAIAVWLIIRIEQSGATARRVIALGGLTLPLMLTHYLAVGTCLAIVVWGGLRLPRRAILQLGGAVALSAALFLLVWGSALVQDTPTGIPGFLRSDGASWRSVLRSTITLPWRLLAYPKAGWLPLALGALCLSPLGLVFLRRARQALPWVLFLALPLVFVLGLDLMRDTRLMAVPRYLATVSIAVPAALLVATAALSRGAAWGTGLLVLGALAFARPTAGRQIGSPFFHPIVDRFAPIIQQDSARLPLILHDHQVRRLGYFGSGLMAQFLHAGVVVRPMMRLKSEQGMAHLFAELAPGTTFWFVTSDEGSVPTGLPAPFTELASRLEVQMGPIRQPRLRGGFSERPGARLYQLRLRQDADLAARASP